MTTLVETQRIDLTNEEVVVVNILIDLTGYDTDETVELALPRKKRQYLEDFFPEMKEGGDTEVDSDHESDEDYEPPKKRKTVETPPSIINPEDLLDFEDDEDSDDEVEDRHVARENRWLD